MTKEELKAIEGRAASFMGRYVARDGLCGAIPAGEELATDVTALCAAVRERDATIAKLEAQVTRDVLTLARLRSALASASCDLAGGDARAVMVRTAIDITLAAVPS